MKRQTITESDIRGMIREELYEAMSKHIQPGELHPDQAGYDSSFDTATENVMDELAGRALQFPEIANAGFDGSVLIIRTVDGDEAELDIRLDDKYGQDFIVDNAFVNGTLISNRELKTFNRRFSSGRVYSYVGFLLEVLLGFIDDALSA